MVLAGCGPATFPYRVVTNDCFCDTFRISDAKASVTYSFSAVYRLDGAMSTTVTVDIRNGSSDTLDLSLAYVKISSRNIPYRYNNRFLPVTLMNVPPGETRTLTLHGDVDDTGRSDPWLAIAGEELTLTLKGIRVRGVAIAMQEVKFVPHNPKLSAVRG